MNGSGILTTNWNGYFGRNPRLYQHIEGGYPTGEYYVDHLTGENLQELCDWMITLPEEVYAPIAHIHRGLERFILNRQKEGQFI